MRQILSKRGNDGFNGDQAQRATIIALKERRFPSNYMMRREGCRHATLEGDVLFCEELGETLVAAIRRRGSLHHRGSQRSYTREQFGTREKTKMTISSFIAMTRSRQRLEKEVKSSNVVMSSNSTIMRSMAPSTIEMINSRATKSIDAMKHMNPWTQGEERLTYMQRIGI